jgi:hypothetical protein
MLLREINEAVSARELNDVETFADRLWGKLGVDVSFTRHFIDRLNDERNGKQITPAELIRLFKKEYEQYGKAVSKIDTDGEALFMDLLTDINLPFVIKDRAAGRELVAKTVMRKKNFKSSDAAFKVQ